jgi:hypothetical protein
MLTNQLDELEELSERHQRKIAHLLREVDCRDEKLNRQELDIHRLTNQIVEYEMAAMEREFEQQRAQQQRHQHHNNSRQRVSSGTYMPPLAGNAHRLDDPHSSSAAFHRQRSQTTAESKDSAVDNLVVFSATLSTYPLNSWIEAGGDVVSAVLGDCESTIVSSPYCLLPGYKHDMACTG